MASELSMVYSISIVSPLCVWSTRYVCCVCFVHEKSFGLTERSVSFIFSFLEIKFSKNKNIKSLNTSYTNTHSTHIHSCSAFSFRAKTATLPLLPSLKTFQFPLKCVHCVVCLVLSCLALFLCLARLSKYSRGRRLNEFNF